MIFFLKLLKLDDILVLVVDDEIDYYICCVLVVEIILNDKVVIVVSFYLLWFEKGFVEEWKWLEIILFEVEILFLFMGDFNNFIGN